jgi:hypothetical protein
MRSATRFELAASPKSLRVTPHTLMAVFHESFAARTVASR